MEVGESLSLCIAETGHVDVEALGDVVLALSIGDGLKTEIAHDLLLLLLFYLGGKKVCKHLVHAAQAAFSAIVAWPFSPVIDSKSAL